MEATPSSTLSLPKPIDISSDQLRFLNHHFPAQEDVLHKAPPLLAALRSHYSDLNSHLQALQTALTQRTVSWIRLSSSAKTTLHNLHISLQNLSLLTSQYGSGLKKLQRVLGTELPQLAREVLRIETIRSYLETTLQLEARVGDLEDAVFCFVNFHGGKMFSGMLSNSSDAGTKHEKLLQAIKALNDLEVLVDVMKLRPQWHHLLTSVDGRVDKTLAILRPQVFADHRSLLASLGWPPKLSTSQIESEKIADLPNPLVLMQGEKRKSYSNSFLALCALQHLQTRREKRQLNLLGQEVCMIQLWAIDELVSPIASRLEYHFSKWIDQPELIFALSHKTTRGFIAGVDDVLQPLIDKARLVNYSAKEAWVAAMVQLLSEFLAKSIFTDLAERYQDKQMKSEVIELWLHLVDLIVLFDKQMQSLVSSDVTLFLTESERVESLSGSISALMVFCKRLDWLKIWGKIELKNACRKFKTDLKSERAWLVDEKHQDALQLDTEFEQFLLSTREDYRAPLIAESALRITWEMVEKCQTMPSTLARIQFVRSTAVKHYDQQLEGLTPVEISAAMDITISVDFIEPLDVLRSHLMLLRMRLNPKDFLDLWRSVSEGLDHFISSSGIGCGIQPFDNRIKQFETDMQALFSVFQPFCVRPEAFFPRTIETIKLLKMNKGRRILHVSFDESGISLRDAGTKHEKLLQAIKALNDLEVLVDVMKLRPQWHHLLTSVDGRVDKTLAILRPQVFADHRSLLASLGWPPKLSTSQIESEKIADLPNPLVLMQGEKRKSYSNSFLALCALQHLQTRREKRQLNLLGQEVCMIQLWAIDELVSPIASRLEYHFSKWIDQPELIFALSHKTTRGFIAGVDDVLQPLIDKARLVNYSAKEAWVAAMVQLLSEFLAKSIFTDLAERYQDKQMKSEVIELWLHLVDLIVLFDKQMQSLVSSDVTLFLTESERVESLSGSISALMVFCKRLDWLKIWGKIELKNACRKFKTDLKSERAWLVDEKHQDALQLDTEFEQFLLSTREDYRAPLIAESALRITWEMVEKCQTMPSTLARIQFVRSTAVRFLWYFFKVLLLRCNKTEISPDNLDDDALVRLSGSVNASKYVESKLRQWSDDVNFLEMKVAENDTSDQEKDDSTEISFFREEIKSLSELATNWLLEIISVLLRQFETLSWEYVQKVKHYDQQLEGLTPVEISAAMDITISVDFIEPLDVLRSHLMLLRMRLNPKDFLDLWRSVSEGLDHFISSSGIGCGIQPFDNRIKQFETDMQALFSVFQPFCVRPEAFFPRTIETIKLLKMNKGRR
ncbi:hypothetical protein C1H46_039202 [Malus baccata]|uniref:RAD50-interacting protein 1 n=1 Tax=Malus baccata TaxID=106549 RepID=A0A540KM39_MALBA|nr:hypothetical protein C1H46_039202 [Malus baccata]